MSTDSATYSMVLGGLISQRLEEQGIMQKKFFEDSGIATGTWSRIMRGQAHFQIEDLRSACRVLGTTVGKLTTDADRKMEKLRRDEGINFVSKDDLSPSDSNAGAFIAGAALLFLLSRL